MAASNEPNLRYTTEVPLMENTLNAAMGRASLTQSTVRRLGLSVTSVSEMREKVSLLMDFALQNEQEDRVNRLIEMLNELDEIERKVEAHFGKKIPPNEIKLGFETTYLDETNYSTYSHSDSDSSSEEEEEEEEEEVDAPRRVVEEVDDTAVEECPVCFDEFPRSEMRSFLACDNHLHCKDCMSDYLEAKIGDGEVDKLVCPDLNCDARPEEYEIESLASPETYQKYLQFMVLGSINTDKNARWCINKECGQAIVWDPSQKKVTCPACQTESCFECKAAWHEGMPCNANPDDMAEADQKFQEWLSEKGVKVKPCPQCNVAIEKNSGCNHMTCTATGCGFQWCWLCHGQYGSTHYSSGPCSGLQFTEVDTLEEAAGAQEDQRTVQLTRARARVRRRHRRRHRRRAKKVGIGIALAPVVIVGGVACIALGAVALPFIAVAAAVK